MALISNRWNLNQMMGRMFLILTIVVYLMFSLLFIRRHLYF